jgi:DNA-binding response OmpR family regulator
MHMLAHDALNESRAAAVSGTIVADPILVIDDDPECCRVMTDMLERAGYRVEWTLDPTFALPRIHERRYALVVSDIEMPRMRGTELAAETARVRPPVPTLLVSGRSDEGTRANVRALGAELLTKPFRSATFLKTVDALVGAPPDARTGETCP